MISVIILTKNEENDLPSCISSLDWCDDIHVVDSFSDDNTIGIASSLGATTYINPFVTFAQQRNWSLDNCNLRYNWVLFLDADEHSTLLFKNALFDSILTNPQRYSGYFCCGKTILGKRWLKLSDNFPKWQFRLLNLGEARFVDVGHGQKEGFVKGSIGYIKEPYLHFPFSHGITAWRSKHHLYAIKDAKYSLLTPLSLKRLTSEHGSTRNAAIKTLARRLPGWPLIRFTYTYLLRGGFLEAKEGLDYCKYMMWYEYQVKAALKSLKD